MSRSWTGAGVGFVHGINVSYKKTQAHGGKKASKQRSMNGNGKKNKTGGGRKDERKSRRIRGGLHLMKKKR